MGFGKDYVVGWGTLALVNAGLAQGKGRSGGNWFLISLLVGPLATLAIVLLDKIDVPAPVRAPLAPWVQLVAGGLLAVAVVLAILGRH
jgi:hypothetical protein